MRILHSHHRHTHRSHRLLSFFQRIHWGITGSLVLCFVTAGNLLFTHASPYLAASIAAATQDPQLTAAKAVMAAARAYADSAQAGTTDATLQNLRTTYITQLSAYTALPVSTDSAAAGQADVYSTQAKNLVAQIDSQAAVLKNAAPKTGDTCTIADAQVQQMQRSLTTLQDLLNKINTATTQAEQTKTLTALKSYQPNVDAAFQKEVLVGLEPSDIAKLTSDVQDADTAYTTAESRYADCLTHATVKGQCDTQAVEWASRLVDYHDLIDQYTARKQQAEDTTTAINALIKKLPPVTATAPAATPPTAPVGSPTTAPAATTTVPTTPVSSQLRVPRPAASTPPTTTTSTTK